MQWMHSRATFFRHSAVLSLPAVLLRKVPNLKPGPTVLTSLSLGQYGKASVWDFPLTTSLSVIKWLLLTEFEVRTVSYGPSFSTSFYGPRGYSQKNWVGVCGPLPFTLNLFMTKTYEIPYPIYDLTLKSKPSSDQTVNINVKGVCWFSFW